MKELFQKLRKGPDPVAEPGDHEPQDYEGSYDEWRAGEKLADDGVRESQKKVLHSSGKKQKKGTEVSGRGNIR